jgi:septum formation protein
MPQFPFILASSSPFRLALLQGIGMNPDMIASADINETPQPHERPRHLASRLAREKLQAILAQKKNAFVLAADTVVACGRRILPKAECEDEVRACLTLLSGRRHHVYTGLAIAAPDGSIRERLVDSVVIFRVMAPEDIDAYIASGEGVGKAGGYAIQGRAAAYIRFISGSYSNIVGLPLFEVAQLLRGGNMK